MVVAGLTRAEREEIAAKIRGGGEPAGVVRRFVAGGPGRHRHADGALEAFLKALRRGVADLEGRVEEVARITPEERAVLEQGGPV
jgi:hypothetical protein